jgi:hypothetical protein
MSRQANRTRARLRAARDFFHQGKPWSRTLAFKILRECANTAQLRKVNARVTAALVAGDTSEVFRLLEGAVESTVEDILYAAQEGYTRDFDDWLVADD